MCPRPLHRTEMIGSMQSNVIVHSSFANTPENGKSPTNIPLWHEQDSRTSPAISRKPQYRNPVFRRKEGRRSNHAPITPTQRPISSISMPILNHLHTRVPQLPYKRNPPRHRSLQRPPNPPFSTSPMTPKYKYPPRPPNILHQNQLDGKTLNLIYSVSLRGCVSR